jgi:ABC-type cobalamin/Fe3+-siderophores transport system ATPase subunit
MMLCLGPGSLIWGDSGFGVLGANGAGKTTLMLLMISGPNNDGILLPGGVI